LSAVLGLRLGCGRLGLFLVAAEMALQVGLAHALARLPLAVSSTTMSGVMPLAWIERPEGVK
jgi:hypothetical protein